MPAIAEPTQDLDLSILEDLDFPHKPKCAVHGCGNDATHLLICGECGEGTEYICKQCIARAMAASFVVHEAGNFVFDESCGHKSHITRCHIREI